MLPSNQAQERRSKSKKTGETNRKEKEKEMSFYFSERHNHGRGGKDWAKLRPQASVHTLASTVMPSSLMSPERSQTHSGQSTVCVCFVLCVWGVTEQVRLRVTSSWLRGTSLVSMHSPSSISVLGRNESVSVCFYPLRRGREPHQAQGGCSPRDCHRSTRVRVSVSV
jgi:hypothetical protein